MVLTFSLLALGPTYDKFWLHCCNLKNLFDKMGIKRMVLIRALPFLYKKVSR